MCQKACDHCMGGARDVPEVDYSEHAKAMISIISEAKRMYGLIPCLPFPLRLYTGYSNNAHVNVGSGA